MNLFAAQIPAWLPAIMPKVASQSAISAMKVA